MTQCMEKNGKHLRSQQIKEIQTELEACNQVRKGTVTESEDKRVIFLPYKTKHGVGIISV